MPVKFLDAHHHFWDLERNPRYPWLMGGPSPPHLGDSTPIKRSYLPDDYRRDLTPVDLVGSVHVEASWEQTDPVGETRWLAELRKAQGLPTAIVTYVDLSAADPLPVLEAQAAFDGVRGVRCMTVRPGQGVADLRPGETRLSDAGFRANLRLLERFNLSFDAQGTPPILPDVAALADACPIPIALTHVGLPLQRDDASRQLWRDGLAVLAQRPNVTVKLSGLAMINPEWTADSIRDMVRIVVDLFGPGRCMVGTNFPVDKLRADPHDLLRAIVAALDPYGSDARYAVMAGTAARFYRVAQP